MDKIFLNRILPEYVINDQEKFVDFMSIWLDFSANNLPIDNMLEFTDVDSTDALYLKKIKKYMSGGVELLESDASTQDRMLLKNIKNIYDTKGTPSAIEYVFNYYYNTSIKINYLKEKMLIASGGHWIKPYILRIKSICGFIPEIAMYKNVKGITSYAIGTIIDIKYDNNNDIYVWIAYTDGTFISGEAIEVLV
jgi:hypothetical protein